MIKGTLKSVNIEAVQFCGLNDRNKPTFATNVPDWIRELLDSNEEPCLWVDCEESFNLTIGYNDLIIKDGFYICRTDTGELFVISEDDLYDQYNITTD